MPPVYGGIDVPHRCLSAAKIGVISETAKLSSIFFRWHKKQRDAGPENLRPLRIEFKQKNCAVLLRFIEAETSGASPLPDTCAVNGFDYSLRGEGIKIASRGNGWRLLDAASMIFSTAKYGKIFELCKEKGGKLHSGC